MGCRTKLLPLLNPESIDFPSLATKDDRPRYRVAVIVEIIEKVAVLDYDRIADRLTPTFCHNVERNGLASEPTIRKLNMTTNLEKQY